MSSSPDNLTMMNFESSSIVNEDHNEKNSSTLNLNLSLTSPTEIMGIIVKEDHSNHPNNDRSEDGSDSGLGSELLLDEHELICRDGTTNNENISPPVSSPSSSSAEMIDDILNEVGEQQKKQIQMMDVPFHSSNSNETSVIKQSILKSNNRKRKLSPMHDENDMDEREEEEPLLKKKRHVSFNNITVFYFPRMQGFTCVPSKGGSTLGMASHHHQVKTFSLSEHAMEQRKLHRQQILEQQMEKNGTIDEQMSQSVEMVNASDELSSVSTTSNSDNDNSQGQVVDCDGGSAGEDSSDETVTSEESEIEDMDDNCYYFLQPVSIKQRRALLRAAGIRKIDSYEKDECETIRTSREFCGCACKGYCDPDSCSCSQAGIKCQVDRSNFPCGCTSRDNCGNTSGRIEFNPIGVRTHFIHTLMRLDLEKKQDEEEEGLNGGRGRERRQKQIRFCGDGGGQEDMGIEQQQFSTSNMDEGFGTLIHSSSSTTSTSSLNSDLTSSREDSMDLLSTFRENYYCHGDGTTVDSKLYASSASRYPEFHLTFPLSKSLESCTATAAATTAPLFTPIATSTAAYISTPSNQYARIHHHHHQQQQQQQQQHAIENRVASEGLFQGGFSNNFFNSSFSEIYESFQQRNSTSLVISSATTSTVGNCIDHHFSGVHSTSTVSTSINHQSYTSTFEENQNFSKNFYQSITGTGDNSEITANNNSSNTKLKSFCDLLKNNGYHYIDYGNNDGSLNNYQMNNLNSIEEESTTTKKMDDNSLMISNNDAEDGNENFGEIIKKSIVETDGFCIN